MGLAAVLLRHRRGVGRLRRRGGTGWQALLSGRTTSNPRRTAGHPTPCMAHVSADEEADQGGLRVEGGLQGGGTQRDLLPGPRPVEPGSRRELPNVQAPLTPSHVCEPGGSEGGEVKRWFGGRPGSQRCEAGRLAGHPVARHLASLMRTPRSMAGKAAWREAAPHLVLRPQTQRGSSRCGRG